ncbi:PAS domain-containing protein [Pedobacter aquatilis]|uniref:PAS domain-containing protein n=1 Tax=Pedobacter aquatilis TaxID=351343 RepID=UPI0025B38F56|nr:PAS domain-containing protein [Pedobacter aquatilis]MDN3588508.1 PAS domain-containing protein [Pedobacter aquatilis]
MRRIAALEYYRIAGTQPEAAFDELTKLASRVFNVPIALICFIGKEQVYYKSNVGYGTENTQSRSNSLCNQAMQSKQVMVINDVRIAAPDISNPKGIAFYAAAPLITRQGERIGTICIMDYQSRNFDENQQEILSGLAKVVMDRTELRLIALDEILLREQNEHITSLNNEIVNRNTDLMEYQDQVSQANSLLESILDSYERLFKHTPVAIGICSGSTKIIWQSNDALNKIFGGDDSLIGQQLDSVVSEAGGVKFISLLDEVYTTRKPYHAAAVKLIINYKGVPKILYANLSLQPVARMGDEPDNIMFILADVTELVVSKQLTHEANLVLTKAIEVAGMGYTVVEFATGEMTSNNQLKKNYGYLPEQSFGYSDLFDTILPKYKQRIREAVQHAIDTNGIYRAEYEVKWSDGSTHWIRGFGKPVYNADGKATHIIGLNQIIDKP